MSLGSVFLAIAIVELFMRSHLAPPRAMLTRASRVKDFRVTADGIVLFASGYQGERCAARRPGVPVVSLFG